MSDKPVIPDKSAGGTFHYDAQGNFVEHKPPTKPAQKTPSEAAKPAEPKSKK